MSKQETVTKLPTAKNAENKMNAEQKENHIEVLEPSSVLLRKGISESMNLLDESANVLHSTMSWLTPDDPEVRKPTLEDVDKIIMCANGIANLMRSKSEMLKLLKKK